MRVDLLTVATARTAGLDRLEFSLRRFGHRLRAVGFGEYFHGFGWRLKRLVRAIGESTADVIIHLDAYDTVCLEPLPVALEAFRLMGKPVLASFEPAPQPEYWLTLNPGMIIGYRDALLAVFTDTVLDALFPDHFNDMYQMQLLWANDQSLFAVDSGERIFFTQSALNPHRLERRGKLLVNPRTSSMPAFVHAPNGASLDNVEEWLYAN